MAAIIAVIVMGIMFALVVVYAVLNSVYSWYDEEGLFILGFVAWMISICMLPLML